MHIRTASVDDAAAIAEIYNQGIEDRVATYETKRRSAEDQQAWLQAIAGRYPAVVAQIDGEIVGWAGAGQEVVSVEDAPAREAGEIIEDDGTGAEKIVAFLDNLKVL